jgi:hypothetical protein
VNAEPLDPILGIDRTEVVLALYNLSNYYLEHALHLYAAGIGVGIAECCTTQVGGQRAVMLVEMLRQDCEEDLNPMNEAAKGTLIVILSGLALEFNADNVEPSAAVEIRTSFPEVVQGINTRIALSEYGGLTPTNLTTDN